ncbi:MAG: flagellar biosynthesis protein FliQ [Fimbriimonadaceae bacterium]
MDTASAIDIAQVGVQVALMVALPMLAVTLFIGLGVSVFQALTQIQEMTLTFVPKLIGVAALIVILGHWMLQKLVGFAILCFEQASRVGGG